MYLTVGLLIITGFYLWFYFIDRFLKSCSHYAYIQFLKNTGLDIGFLRINWTTTTFNQSFQQHNHFLKKWFDLGLVVTLIALPVAIGFLLRGFLQNFWNKSPNGSNIIEPGLPGVNLPASELGYYGLTLLICSLLHELGHILSATQDDVNIINVGVYIIFLLPIAYSNLNSEKVNCLKPWNKLRILCGGVWHNLVIAFIAYVLFILVPIMFSPFYEIGQGVLIKDIAPKSHLLGPKGLNQFDVINKINDCVITDTNSWHQCLHSLLLKNKTNYCINTDLIHKYDESVPLRYENGVANCCPLGGGDKSKICFEYLDNTNAALEIPPFVCLPARKVLDYSDNLHYCRSSHRLQGCPKNSYCFRPNLWNFTNLFKIEGRLLNDHVIYIGTVGDLSQTIFVSSYIPKWRILTSFLPDFLTKLLEYLTVFSLGFAIVNVLPCLFMDGQYIVDTLFLLLLTKYLRQNQITIISGTVKGFFTLLLVLHCIIVLWKYFV